MCCVGTKLNRKNNKTMLKGFNFLSECLPDEMADPHQLNEKHYCCAEICM